MHHDPDFVVRCREKRLRTVFLVGDGACRFGEVEHRLDDRALEQSAHGQRHERTQHDQARDRSDADQHSLLNISKVSIDEQRSHSRPRIRDRHGEPRVLPREGRIHAGRGRTAAGSFTVVGRHEAPIAAVHARGDHTGTELERGYRFSDGALVVEHEGGRDVRTKDTRLIGEIALDQCAKRQHVPGEKAAAREQQRGGRRRRRDDDELPSNPEGSEPPRHAKCLYSHSRRRAGHERT